MKLSAGKLAPSAIVLAAVGYGVWPYAEPPSPTPSPPGKAPPEIRAALLEPRLGPAPRRDPFHPPGGPALADRGAPGAKPPGSKGAAAKSPAAARAEKKPAPDPRTGLALEATLVNGRRSLAIINGKVYEPGDVILGTEAGAGRVVLADVLRHKVVLAARGARADLAYSTARKAKAEEKAPGSPMAAPARAAQAPDPTSAISPVLLNLLKMIGGVGP